ncbi:MAG: EI24 domain-containing protein [Pikeienuella sp.]
MIDDFAKAIGQLTDRRFLGVLVLALAITTAILGGLAGTILWAVGLIDYSFTIPFTDFQVQGLDKAALVFAIAAIGVMSIFLMFPVAAVFIGFMLDRIADAVESEHYPGLPEPRRQPISEAIWNAVKFSLVLIVANILAFIIYLLSTILAPVIFWIVNGYLLSREYYELVALRRMPPKEARQLRKRHFWAILPSGVLIAMLLSVPILNLLAPLVGVAAFVHLYHRKQRD